MPENDRLSGCLDEINLDFVEREADDTTFRKTDLQAIADHVGATFES